MNEPLLSIELPRRCNSTWNSFFKSLKGFPPFLLQRIYGNPRRTASLSLTVSTIMGPGNLNLKPSSLSQTSRYYPEIAVVSDHRLRNIIHKTGCIVPPVALQPTILLFTKQFIRKDQMSRITGGIGNEAAEFPLFSQRNFRYPGSVQINRVEFFRPPRQEER